MERRSFHSPPLECVHSTRPIGLINWRTGAQRQRQHVSTPILIRVKSGKNTEKFRSNTEFRKYGRKNSVSTSVRIPTTSALNSEPIPDFSENTKTDGSDRENFRPFSTLPASTIYKGWLQG
jgi:hypothetical protein